MASKVYNQFPVALILRKLRQRYLITLICFCLVTDVILWTWTAEGSVQVVARIAPFVT